MRKIHAVSVRGSGAAIVSARIKDDGTATITAIQRFGLDVDAVARHVDRLRGSKASVVLDADGLGTAVYELMGKPRPSHTLQVYRKRGPERAELTTTLVVAVARGSFTFRRAIANGDAMKQALTALRKDVAKEDGPGSELAVALALALRPPPVKSRVFPPAMDARGYGFWS